YSAPTAHPFRQSRIPTRPRYGPFNGMRGRAGTDQNRIITLPRFPSFPQKRYPYSMISKIGMFSAIAMPFFDIPLIARIIKRKSSEDISLVWVFGIWVCILGMLPSSLQSPDPILFAFGIVNTILFTAVVLAVVRYHPMFLK